MRRVQEIRPMARWPDNWQSNLIALGMILVVLPLLCALAWWYIRG